MTLLHRLIDDSAARRPDATALSARDTALSYAETAGLVARVSGGLMAAGVAANDRVAVYLPKQIETVAGFFGACRAGGAFVPLNPQLKPAQVRHILRDCDVRVLITSRQRLQTLIPALGDCPALTTIVLTDAAGDDLPGVEILDWQSLIDAAPAGRERIDTDLAAVLYTSGSTGKPKGVMLSHRNMVCGAESVATYLGNGPADRLLTVLPFSFDYGFSQLSTAFCSGATAVLFEYLLPRDVVRAVGRERITGLAGVPPLWNQLARLDWPETPTLRYITNSGGAMPQATLAALRARLPDTSVFLMYGLTEAFRSTYLDPAELDRRPDSMGKAIPNAEILVVRPDGTPCADDEPGELVHRGSLVAMGYWNDPEKTAQRFRPGPQQTPGATLPEIAVWSGDKVRRDAAGFLYFIGRDDEMIKTSGFRVSPTEVEEVIHDIAEVTEAVAFGVPHAELGQAIVVVAVADIDADAIAAVCRREMPGYMVPAKIEVRDELPRNPNGKIDRPAVAAGFAGLFEQLTA